MIDTTYDLDAYILIITKIASIGLNDYKDYCKITRWLKWRKCAKIAYRNLREQGFRI